MTHCFRISLYFITLVSFSRGLLALGHLPPMANTLPDGRQVALQEVKLLLNCGRLKSYSLPDGYVLSLPKFDHAALALSPNGQLLAVAEDEGVALIEVSSGTHIKSLHAPTSIDPRERTVSFSADGRYVSFEVQGFMSHYDPSSSMPLMGRGLKVWDVTSGALMSVRVEEKNKLPFQFATFAPNGFIAFGESRVGPIHLLSVTSSLSLLWPSAARTIGIPDGHFIDSFAMSPDGQMMAITGDSPYERQSNNIFLIDVASGKTTGELAEAPNADDYRPYGGYQRYTRFLQFTPDGKGLVGTLENHYHLSHRDSSLVFWDLATKKQVRTIQGPSHFYGRQGEGIAPVGFTPDGAVFLTVEDADSVPLLSKWRMWSAADGTELFKTEKNTEARKISFSADGSHIAVITRGGIVAPQCRDGVDTERTIRILELTFHSVTPASTSGIAPKAIAPPRAANSFSWPPPEPTSPTSGGAPIEPHNGGKLD